MTYPKWVSRGHGLGEILCLDEAEEAAVLAPKEEQRTGNRLVTWAEVVTEMTAADAHREQEATPRKKPGRKPKVQ